MWKKSPLPAHALNTGISLAASLCSASVPSNPLLLCLWLPLGKDLQGENVLARGPRCLCPVRSVAVSPTVGSHLAVWGAPLSWSAGYLDFAPGGEAPLDVLAGPILEPEKLKRQAQPSLWSCPPCDLGPCLPSQHPLPPFALSSYPLEFPQFSSPCSCEDEVSQWRFLRAF